MTAPVHAEGCAPPAVEQGSVLIISGAVGSVASGAAITELRGDGHRIGLGPADGPELGAALAAAAAVLIVAAPDQALRIRAAAPAATFVKVIDEADPELTRSVLRAARAAAIAVAPPGIGMCG